MFNAPEGLAPLAAYEELMRFAKNRGEAALRLALHAAVPQGFHPELLHLLKRNFVPEAGDDPTTEVDLLFSPLCEHMGRGFFRFDPQVRILLLENLASNYSSEPTPRVYRVANFLLFYVEHYDRSTSARQDRLWRDYLETQRWVALAFVDPEGAARQLAAALAGADAKKDYATRIQLGGLASALAAPLAGYRRLLNYAAGLVALELGDRRKAGDLLGGLGDEELKVGETTLRSPTKIMEEWYARHPGLSPPPPVEAEEEEDAEGSAPSGPNTLGELVRALEDDDRDVRLRAVEALPAAAGPDEAARALVELLTKESDPSVRLAAVRSLAAIGTDESLEGLLSALTDEEDQVRREAVDALGRIEGTRRRVVVVLSPLVEGGRVANALGEALWNRGYLPALLDFTNAEVGAVMDVVSGLWHLTRFLIVDVSASPLALVRSVIGEPSVPVQPIAEEASLFPEVSEYLRELPALPLHLYKSTKGLLAALDERIIAPLEREFTELLGGTPPPVGGPFPEFEYDIFISYAYTDNVPLPGGSKGWVTNFSELLEFFLREHLGRTVRTWRDNKLSGKDDISLYLDAVLPRTALMVCVLSPHYVQSLWCSRELESFIAAANRTGGLTVNNQSRLVKVVKTPLLGREALLPVFRDIKGYEFFRMLENSMPLFFGLEFGEEQRQRFQDAVGDVAWDITDMLIAMEAGRGERPEPPPAPLPRVAALTIYLAETGLDLITYRDLMKYELEARGHRVLPDGPLPTDLTELEARLSEDLARCDLSVHLVGGDYGSAPEGADMSLPELQYEAVAGRGDLARFTPIVWMPAGVEAEDSRQREFLRRVENASAVELLQTNFEELKSHVISRLREHTRAVNPTPGERASLIYLINDPTDAGAAQPLADFLTGLGYSVVQNKRADEDELIAFEQHMHRLKTCDAVIIHYSSAPEAWLHTQFAQMRKISMKRREPLLAKAVYMAGESAASKGAFAAPDILVIVNYGEFDPLALEPFLEALSSGGRTA